MRLLSLDILRGITVAGMIIVNNGYGESFMPLCHSKWNGMTPCDLVFPFFLFIMGISTYLSMSKVHFKPSPTLIWKIIRRTILLFLIGLLINWFEVATKGAGAGIDHLRFWGVLQRIALCYCIVSFIVLAVRHKWIVPLIIALLVIYSVILLLGNGYAEDSTNILARTDMALLGPNHLYTKSPIDPEGLLGTIPSVAHVLIGFYVGMKIKKADTTEFSVFKILIIAATLILIGYLLSFALPLNKRVWSPSFVLTSCGMGAALQAILMHFIDVRHCHRWYAFFHVFGVNPLFLYILSEILSISLKRIGVSETVFTAINSVVVHQQTASIIYAVYFLLLNFVFGYFLFRKKIFIKL